MPVIEAEPFKLAENEKAALNQIEGALEKGKPKLVGPKGEFIEIPNSIFEVLKQIVNYMMHGRAIFVVPDNQQLTTQEAANILGVSRPYLIKLLDQHRIPYDSVGTHRRILFGDLLRYKAERDAARKRGLDEIAQMSQQSGHYD